MVTDKVHSFLNSPITWGIVTFVLAAIAVSGRLSVTLSNILLFIAFLIGCFGIYHSGCGTHFRIIGCLMLGVGLTSVSWWLKPDIQSQMPLQTTSKSQSGAITQPTAGEIAAEVAKKVFKKNLVNRNEKKHAHSFLQVNQPTIVGGSFTPGSKIGFNVHWRNESKERVFDVLTLSKLYIIENATVSSDMTVKKRFNQWMEPFKQDYLSGAIRSSEQVGIGNFVWQSVFAEPLSNIQYNGLFDGSTRLYVLSWCGWKDDEGTRDFVFDCQWLQALPKGGANAYSDSDFVWHSCAVTK